jgi:hypothetical protein
MCHGEMPTYCSHQTISYKSPIQVPDKFRRFLINSKAYLGIFGGLTMDLREMYSLLNPYQFFLWEMITVNPNNLKKYLILKVTYRLPYYGSGTETYSLGMSSKGLFFILHQEKLPGNAGFWYYPLMHYPSFHRVSDLLRYLNFLHNYSAYSLASLYEIAEMEGRYRNFNKFHMINYSTTTTTTTTPKCKLCNSKQIVSSTTNIGNVRSLQNLAACIIQTYSIKIAFDPVLLYKLKGTQLPVSIFNYLCCTPNYIYDDVKLSCTCFMKKY